MSLDKERDTMLRPSKKALQRDEQAEDVEGGSDDNSKGDKAIEKARSLMLPTSKKVPFVLVSLWCLMWVLSSRSSSKGWRALMMIMSIPLLLASSVVAGAWNAQRHQRLIALSFVGAIAANRFPHFVSAAVAAVSLTAFSLSTRTRETEPSVASAARRAAQLRAVSAAFCLIVVLLTDNFFVWVVSATYYPSHNGQAQPLQDNGRLLQTYFFEQILDMSRREVVRLRGTVNVQWALVAALACTFVVCELQWVPKRTMYGVATHTLLTLACARIIRVISFLLTVLPSQMTDCYWHHFPLPLPSDWWSWLQVGFLPSTSGGCNDLIVSGHATVTSILACVSTSVVGHWAFSTALWSMLAFDFMIEVYEGFHYSVDMWMGALITVMLWRILSPLEQTEKDVSKREFQTAATMQDMILYAIPSVGAYLIMVVSPRAIANYWIVLYCVVAVVEAVRHGMGHYLQHLLFCTLYLGLGFYL